MVLLWLFTVIRKGNELTVMSITLYSKSFFVLFRTMCTEECACIEVMFSTVCTVRYVLVQYYVQYEF